MKPKPITELPMDLPPRMPELIQAVADAENALHDFVMNTKATSPGFGESYRSRLDELDRATGALMRAGMTSRT